MPEDPKAARRALLAKHFLLRSAEAQTIDEILRFSSVRKVASGGEVFARGDEADGLFGVLSGRLKIYVVASDGRELVLNFAAPGDLFGEIALLDGESRSANIAALENCELLFVPRSHFLAFLERNPALMAQMIKVLCGRIRRSSDALEGNIFLDLPARIAKHLLALDEEMGEDVPAGRRLATRLPQRLLAEMTGATREAVNKALKSLRDAGLVAFQDGHYVLLDREALEDMVM